MRLVDIAPAFEFHPLARFEDLVMLEEEFELIQTIVADVA